MGQPIPILHDSGDLLVVHKPAGLLSMPSAAGRALPELLREQGLEALPVHRLDREVSGCVLLARTGAMRQKLEDLFRERLIAKTYWALVRGVPRKDEGSIQYPILHERRHGRVSAQGKAAHTRYRVLRRMRFGNDDVTEVEIELVTGRYNQIRVHFAHDKLPLIGERKYARGGEDPLKAGRLALHAWRLAFAHPGDGSQVTVEAPLPGELNKLVARCRSVGGG